MFTGDFLFVGDVGRPDLLGEEARKQLAHQLYQQRLRACSPPLPDFTEVFPAHGAGSLCGKAIGSRRLHARLRAALQRALWPASRRPSGWTTLLNGHAARAALLSPDEEGQRRGPDGSSGRSCRARSGSRAKEVHERVCEHCLVVDVRPKEAFAAAHIPGSINIPLGPNLPTWAGWVLPYDKPS